MMTVKINKTIAQMFVELMRWPHATDENMRYVIAILVDQQNRIEKLERDSGHKI